MDTNVIECPDCDGTGWGVRIFACSTCNGTGQVIVTMTPGPKRPA